MHATSTAQFHTATNGGIPDLEEVRERLFCYGLPQPGTQPHYTLSYLLLDSENRVHVIDPGWDSPENWAAFTATLTELGRTTADVASLTVTHLHPDHLGMAERMRTATHAPVAVHAEEQAGITELSTPLPDSAIATRLAAWGVPQERQSELVEAAHLRSRWPSFTADTLLNDGDILDIPGHRVRVLHTPGHTSGHIALVDEERGVIFLGDLLLPNQFPGIGLGGTATSATSQGNPIDHYLTSLAAVSTFDRFEALPGHAYRFIGIAKRSAETTAHHENRTHEVASIGHPDAAVWDLAGQLTWTAGWENLSGLPLLSALSQTALHAERARRSS